MSDDVLVSGEFADDALLIAIAEGQATLGEHAKGESVVALQKALTALGIALRPDGSFGPKTREALQSWQNSAGISESGVVDSETILALDKTLADVRKSNLNDAIARAVGVNPNRPAPAPRPVPIRAETPSDSAYFTDAASLPPVGHAAVEDPDTPPPAVDKIKPFVAPGTPLAADRQEMLGRLQEVIGGDYAANAALARIVGIGRFHSGKLLPNLVTLATKKRHPELLLQGGIDSDLIVRQTIRHVDNPLRVQQGIGRGTCGAGVIEYLLLRRDPAEFVRLIDGITGFNGEAKLRSGRTLKLPRTAIVRDESERVDIDRLFQSTIMNHATAMSWIFDYDNAKDDESFWSAVQGNSQMPLWGFCSMFEDIIGESWSTISVLGRSVEKLAQDILAEVDRGERVPIILRFTSLHWLSVDSVVRGADGHVTWWILRNPWGWDDGTGSPPREPMPEGCGRVRMSPADFLNALFGAVVRS